MTVFFSQLINGLSLGSIYALIALGYSMVYGIILLLNFAHGDVIMVGAYMSWFVMNQRGLGPVTAVCATIITCTLLGVVIEKVAYTPLRNAPRISLLITAIGVSFFLEYTAELVMGSGAKVIPSYYGNKTFMIGSVPLGLTSVVGDQSPKAGELAEEKGTSCWELLENFCRDYLGTAPWVDGKGTLHCEGPQETKVTAGRVLSAELSRLPCKQLSAVWQQSFRGTYDTPFRGAAGVKRQRYVSMEDGRDPRELLRQGERESWLLSVECQGNSWPGPGALVTVEAPRLGRFEDCPLRQARYIRDSRGERTRFVLERGKAVCG